MRLPALTPEQQKHEASRQFCEEMYQAFLDGRRIDVPVTRETVIKVQARISGNTRHFWSGRGFRIRTKADTANGTLSVWLELGPSKQRERAA